MSGIGSATVRMRSVVRSAVATAILVACMCLLVGPVSHAGCVGPGLGIGEEDVSRPQPSPAPASVDRTEEVVVHGLWFHHGCEDTVANGGCSAPSDPQSPMTDVPLVLEQDGRTWELSVASAGERDSHYAIVWTIRLPAEVRSGPAVITAAGAQRAIVIKE